MIERIMTAEPGAAWVFVVGALIIIAACLVVGTMVHRTLFYAIPEQIEDVPADAGAWIGIIVGVLVVLLA